MSMFEHAGEHEAVNRLYELAREGETASGEFTELDSMIYQGLMRTYGTWGDTGQVPRTPTADG